MGTYARNVQFLEIRDGVISMAPNGHIASGSSSDPVALRAEKGLLLIGRLAAYLAYAWLVFVDLLLGFRVFLLLFGANPHAGFARFIYTTSADAMAPFRGLFPPHALEATGYLDVSALFAVLVYTLLVFLVGGLVDWIGWALRSVRVRLGEPPE